MKAIFETCVWGLEFKELSKVGITKNEAYFNPGKLMTFKNELYESRLFPQGTL